MLAILDPELRHSSPSRRQSAALIGSLALISIVVGALPRCRVKRCRTPKARLLRLRLAPSPTIELLSARKGDDKGYPDSRGIIGGSMSTKAPMS